jgi:hypothetical protein
MKITIHLQKNAKGKIQINRNKPKPIVVTNFSSEVQVGTIAWEDGTIQHRATGITDYIIKASIITEGRKKRERKRHPRKHNEKAKVA